MFAAAAAAAGQSRFSSAALLANTMAGGLICLAVQPLSVSISLRGGRSLVGAAERHSKQLDSHTNELAANGFGGGGGRLREFN